MFECPGPAHWLTQSGQNAADTHRIHRNQWLPAPCVVYHDQGDQGLNDAVKQTLAVRDKLHQDRPGAWESIDRDSFSHAGTFVPASSVMQILLRREADAVPDPTLQAWFATFSDSVAVLHAPPWKGGEWKDRHRVVGRLSRPAPRRSGTRHCLRGR